MNLKYILRTTFLIFTIFSKAQNTDKKVLFTINDKPYYTDEFVRVYNKNLDLVKDESQKDINYYLELFIGYKLKVNKANQLGLQNNQKYINELKSYRTQLSKNFTTDSKVTKALIDEAYTRMTREVNASHILIMVDENALPADTLKAYNQILDIRKKIVAGESFEVSAVKNSQDPSAKDNKGNLGYFTAFRMVYPFETAAYKTKVGDVSMPVRTKFGYHLIKVNSVRDNRGEVSVAHIMIAKNAADGKTPVDSEKIKSTINDIYAKLKQGEKFDQLAQQFSEDKNTAAKGGQLPKFSSGQINSEAFENISFGLKNPGDFSEPFETQYGWHIVKLIEKYPLKSRTELERDLDAKIKKDERSRLITNSLTDKLRKKYKISKNIKNLNQVKSIVTNDYYDAKWVAPTDRTKYEGEILKIESKTFTTSQFISELESLQKGKNKIKPISAFVDNAYENFIDKNLNTYYDENLETEFPEFGYIVDEYRDGLLLFDLMEKEIWEKSKTDSIGQKKFYEEHKANYRWKNRVVAEVFSSTNEKMVIEAGKMLKKGKTPEDIKAKLNTKDQVNILLKEETYEQGNEHTPKVINFEKNGLTETQKSGDAYTAYFIKKMIPASEKAFDDCKGRVINDYQQFLEDSWIETLKKEFVIKIDQSVFEQVKAQIKK